MDLCKSDWEMFEKHYSLLMKMISRQITGDYISCNLEDTYQDLCVTAISAIKSYSRKFPNDKFTDLFKTVNFSKYVKSCLWNLKNKKGATITKKSALYKNKLSIDEILDSNF